MFLGLPLTVPELRFPGAPFPAVFSIPIEKLDGQSFPPLIFFFPPELFFPHHVRFFPAQQPASCRVSFRAFFLVTFYRFSDSPRSIPALFSFGRSLFEYGRAVRQSSPGFLSLFVTLLETAQRSIRTTLLFRAVCALPAHHDRGSVWGRSPSTGDDVFLPSSGFVRDSEPLLVDPLAFPFFGPPRTASTQGSSPSLDRQVPLNLTVISRGLSLPYVWCASNGAGRVWGRAIHSVSSPSMLILMPVPIFVSILPPS